MPPASQNGHARPRVIVRPMTLADVDEVVVLDRLGFSTPWSRSTYRYEIERSRRSMMLVLQRADAPPNRAESWLKRLFGSPQPESLGLVGYGGFWQVVDEAHISTITVHPDWRGNKLGELLLWTMIRQAFRRQAQRVTLEVRVSNHVAKNLYRKYEFESVGIRRGYYRDNGEDADVMMVAPLDDRYRARLQAWGEELRERIAVVDKVPHPENITDS